MSVRLKLVLVQTDLDEMATPHPAWLLKFISSPEGFGDYFWLVGVTDQRIIIIIEVRWAENAL